jgi:hypothetical protein
LSTKLLYFIAKWLRNTFNGKFCSVVQWTNGKVILPPIDDVIIPFLFCLKWGKTVLVTSKVNNVGIELSYPFFLY